MQPFHWHRSVALSVQEERVAQTIRRAKLRERVAAEHTLAHVGRWQGRRARYRGLRKNLFDLRRCAVVHNLHILAIKGNKGAHRGVNGHISCIELSTPLIQFTAVREACLHA